ncbi:autotransporter-associated beta strand repeat-containing protein, partial [Bradyrhizobium sp. S69]|uniref:beta strand repeat-containing protein n=1 Tax=Bradyrhizobium sp. S69 TaxID=1641856 RepID=UPI001AEED763
MGQGSGGGGGGYSNTSIPNGTFTLTSGNGGTGADEAGAGNGGGGGGAGGNGAELAGAGPYSVGATSSVTGGNGGNGRTGSSGGFPATGGGGGSGGIGIDFSQTGATLQNAGTITGGNGGTGGTGGAANGANGVGGAGVVGAGLTIVNSGSIAGGLSGDTIPVRADAITFTSGSNFLTLSSGATAGTLTGGISISGSLTIDPGAANGGSATLSNVIQDAANGAGSITLNTARTLTLTGANTYSGGTAISGGGTLVANNAGLPNSSLGSGAVTLNNGTLATNQDTDLFNNVMVAAGGGTIRGSSNFGLDGNITGAGQLTFQNTGAANNNLTILIGDNSAFTGTTIVASGVLASSSAQALSPNSAFQVASGATLGLGGISATIGSLSDSVGGGGVVSGNGLVLTTGGNNGNTTFSGVIQDGTVGTFGLIKAGGGTFTLAGTNTYTGATTVSGGDLRVNGSIASATTVQSGGTLSGIGSVNAAVVVQSGGILSAGQGGPGTLTVASLNLNAGSTSVFELGAAGVVGGASNDLVNVTGSLTLGGTLSVNSPSAGYYRLFNYGTLTPSGYSSVIGSTQGTPMVLTNVANQVNLSVIGAGQQLQFWDGADMAGNGIVNGGAGTWNAANTNWTGAPGQAGINDQWRSSVGVFAGAASGTVSVIGTQAFDTLQFSTSGYALNAGAAGQLQLSAVGGAAATINTDAGVTATINAPLVDGSSTALAKVGAGTLVLAGTNTYTGGTTISAGTLMLFAGGSLASGVINNATFNNLGTVTGSLTNSGTATNGAMITGTVSNSGTFLNASAATVGGGLTSTAGVVTNAGTLNGGATVSGGALTTTGTINGGLVNSATVNAKGGAINGAVANNGGATFNVGGTVTGNSTFANAFGATLALGTTGAYTLPGMLSNSGVVTVASGGQLTAIVGGITNLAGGTITVATGGTVSDDLNNAGTVTNGGAYNANVDTNTGGITNNGAWTGNVASNAGTITNNLTWTGAIVTSGTFINAAGAT